MESAIRKNHNSSSVRKGKAAPKAALEDFARLVSELTHDLRAPLGSIVGAASTIGDYADRIDPDRHSRLCAGIVDEAQYLEHLLTCLAAIAKARSGTLVREVGRVELSELLLGLSARARERGSEHIHITLRPEEVFLDTDPAAIRTLVFAMLDLASGFAPEDGPIDLSLGGNGKKATLALVSDTRPEERTRLRRLIDGAANPSETGTRPTAETVFLAAVREVVHSLGGDFSIQFNEKDSRLCLSVKLPN